MKIPELFFGYKKEVRNNLNIIVNKILKNNLEDQFGRVNCIDTDSLDEFIIKFNVGFDDIKTGKCFYLSELTELLFLSDRFSSENNKKIRVLLTTYQKLAEGFNFQFCTHVINLDFWYNPQKIIQSNSRVDRKSQTKNIFTYLLCYNNDGVMLGIAD